MRYRYSRWDGTQAGVVADADALLDRFADELLAGADLQDLLQRTLQRGLDVGGEHLPGLRDVLEQARDARERELARYDLDTLLDDISDELRSVAELERTWLDGDDGDMPAIADANDTPESRGPNPGAVSTGEQPQPPPGGPAAPDEKDRNENPGIGCDCCGTGGGGCCDPGGGQSGAPSPNPKPGDYEESDGDTRQTGVLVSAGEETTGEPAPHRKRDLRRILAGFSSRRQSYLDGLPTGPAAQLAAFAGYDFVNPEAYERLRRLQSRLARLLKRHYLPDLTETERFGEVMDALSRCLQEAAGGAADAIADFEERYRAALDDKSENLAARVQRQVALMQSLKASLTPEVREQLEHLTTAALHEDLAHWEHTPPRECPVPGLEANLASNRPPAKARTYHFRGREKLNLSQALHLMDRLDRLERLQEELRQASPAGIGNVDGEGLRTLLGDEAYSTLTALQQMCCALEQAGYLERRGARVALTARSVRRLGDRAARDIFAHLKRDSLGRHAARAQGTGFDRMDERKTYEFGDPFLLDVEGTIRSAVTREGPRCPVRLTARDFVVYRSEASVRVATVLLIDLSRSMMLRGCFVAARRVALALHSLIRERFPRDSLHMVGFSDRARELQLDMLPRISWDDHATNMQEGIGLARKLLSHTGCNNRQIIMVTDGEPTAHLDGDHIEFSYPPSAATLESTLHEVRMCTRESIVINTFMLERGHYLADFVDRMTRLNRGRAFFAPPEHLGEFVLADYVVNR